MSLKRAPRYPLYPPSLLREFRVTQGAIVSRRNKGVAGRNVPPIPLFCTTYTSSHDTRAATSGAFTTFSLSGRTPPARRAWRQTPGSLQIPPFRPAASTPPARMGRAPPAWRPCAPPGCNARRDLPRPPRPDSMPSRPTGSQPGISHSRSGHGPIHVSPFMGG